MLTSCYKYCGGGDLAGVINATKKRGQHIAEDTVWDYFLQIVLALHHCHSPHIKPGSPTEVLPNVIKRAPILHRDLKPENGMLMHWIILIAYLIPSSSLPRCQWRGQAWRLWAVETTWSPGIY